MNLKWNDPPSAPFYKLVLSMHCYPRAGGIAACGTSRISAELIWMIHRIINQIGSHNNTGRNMRKCNMVHGSSGNSSSKLRINSGG